MGRKKSNRKCSIDGCTEDHYAKGWCEKHWKRNQVHGSPYLRSEWVIIDERLSPKESRKRHK